MDNIDEKETERIGLQGLSTAEVKERRDRFGENRLPVESGISIFRILLNQIKSPLIYIIMTAAILSLVLGEYGDFAIIIVVVIADVILGSFQEYQAQKTYVSLKGLIHPTSVVIRDGKRAEVEVWELVPGDIALLTAGDKVPADGLLIETIKVSVDESILTGESEPVVKESVKDLPETVRSSDAGILQDRLNKAYMGTTVVTGRGFMRIEQIGTETELGKIAAILSSHSEADTPFQIRLKVFSKILTRIVLIFTILLLLIGLLMGRNFLDMLRTAIILAVAAIPEGLLIAVTVILVLGMRKILKRNGLVKKLHAVETLGSVTVICTDKTGTLTEGLMKVNKTSLTDEKQALLSMVFCNNLQGAVEIALWQYAEQQMQTDPQKLADKSVRLSEELFSSETKYMITEVTAGPFDTSHMFYLKGAPEIVLSMCSMEEPERSKILGLIDEWAGEGLRLLGLAYRQGGTVKDLHSYSWAGLAGMEDPIREDVIESVKSARGAGIEVKMITGDYQRTAGWIASRIGLMTDDSQILDGEAIAGMTDEELCENVHHTAVFARIRPNDKYRIIKALQHNGEITAMIGDGVNDSPALKQADIGVVVGTATDLAKETADLILLDNHFRTIVVAIEEGRIIFSNVRKSVAYMLSNSFAEVLTIFIAMLLKWPAPLLIAQILWIHLICDGPSDIVLGFEHQEAGIMSEKPRSLKEPILTKLSAILIFVISISSALFSLYLFNHMYDVHKNIAEGQSIVFASLAINSMVYIFAYRSMRLPIHRMNRLSSNKPLIWSVLAGIMTVFAAFGIPGLRRVLGLVSLKIDEWGLVFGFALLLLAIVEIAKAVNNRFQQKTAGK